MLPAHAHGMHRTIPFLLLLCCAGCGGGSLTLEGTLAEPAGATEVWVFGRPERVPVENGAFRIEDVEGDTIELRFVTGDDRHARMVVHDLPDGGSLRLDGVWFADEVAFPARAEGGSGRPLVVNGLRMAGAGAVPENVNLPGTVLAVAEDGDALVMRPDDASLPDLDVLITPASVVRTIDGDAVDPDGLEFGDSLRVSGIGEGGRVIAAEVMVSRRVAADADDGGEDRAEVDGAVEATRSPEPVAREAAVAPAERAGPGRSDGRGNGKGRGRGKGRD